MYLYLDMVSGISGDMTLGALVDLGVPLDWVSKKLKPILTGFNLRSEVVFKHHLRAVSLFVDVTDTTQSRHYTDIKELISGADLPEAVRANSLTAFEKIAAAEAHIHGKSMDEVHFHEIGGIDSLVDIMGSFLCLDYLGISRVFASNIPLGSGFVDCAHGRIPVPVPATLAILKGLPVTGSDAKTEIVTPTGAAIVATLAPEFTSMPDMEIKAVGYGAGKRETGSASPNLLRMVIGAPVSGETHTDPFDTDFMDQAHMEQDRVMVIKTNVDDMNPEILGFVMEELLDQGALDVCFVPLFMKKNRPATQIEVICRQQDTTKMSRILLTQTTAIGVRYHPCGRLKLKRETMICNTSLGKVQVKKTIDPSGGSRLMPEYEVCARVAREQGIPLKDIYARIMTEVNPLDRDQTRLYKTREDTNS